MINHSVMLNAANAQINHVYRPPSPRKANQLNNSGQKDKTAKKKKDEKVLEDEFGEIKSKSEDGDTLRVKDSKDISDKKNKSENKDLKNYTDTQLEEMYLSGKITGEDYTLEMETREAEEFEKEVEKKLKDDQESSIEDSNKRAQQFQQLVGLADKNKEEGKARKIIFSEDSSDTISYKSKLEALDKLEDISLSKEEKDKKHDKSARPAIEHPKMIKGNVSTKSKEIG